MIFWDTSALVPLLVIEPTSSQMEAVLRADPEMVAWWGTRVECLSALARLRREAVLDRTALDASRRVLERIAADWHEILPSEVVRGHAERLLLRHPLRAADALQLAAAVTWAEGQPNGHALATLDTRLADAAHGEGFRLVAPAPTQR